MPNNAFKLDLAAHQVDEVPHNSQPYSRPPVAAAMRAITLHKGLEEPAPVRLCDPDTRVMHSETKVHLTLPCFLHGHTDRDLTMVREVHVVVQQMTQHMPEMLHIIQQDT